MQAYNRQIKEGIQRIAGTYGKDFVYSVDCNVISVDEAARTCKVDPLTTTLATGFSEVLLCADPNDGLICIPAVDSTVRVAVTNKGEKYVLQYSDLDKVKIIIGQIEVYVSSDGVLLGDGSFNGLVKVTDLVSKLNALESDLNTLKTLFTSWVVVPSDGGAALKTITSTWAASQLTTTVQSDLENTTIKHGI